MLTGLEDKNVKREFLRKVGRILQKSSEAETQKRKKKKLAKRNKPKGILMNKIGMMTFWLLFSFMFLVTTITIFSSPADGQKNATNENHNKLFSHEGLEFAKEFVHEYLTWTNDKFSKERREQNLTPYFLDAVGKVENIVFDKEWASSVDKRDIILKEIEKINENQARFIFKTIITFEKPTEKKDTKINYERFSFEEVLEQEKKVIIKNGRKILVTEKYISVPIYYNKERNKFAIYELPAFTYVEDKQLDDEINSDIERLEKVKDTFLENNILAFLDTFFESYSKDSKEKLSYILEDEKHQNGLSNSMHFVKVDEADIYMVDDHHNRFVVQTQAILRDPKIKIEFVNSYLIVIKRKDQRYVVESLNDEQYVNSLISGVLSNREDVSPVEGANYTDNEEKH